MIEFKHWEITQRARIEDVMKIVFKTSSQARVAVLIINGILEKGKYSEEFGHQQFGVYEEDMHKIFLDSKVSRPTFFKVLKRLRNIGLIKKDYSFYYLSMDFANALRRLERTVRSIIGSKIKDVKPAEEEI
ncbi:MAG: hypothetical protein QW350_00795 [Candidatus Aenigmatarchaeota archaeon]